MRMADGSTKYVKLPFKGVQWMIPILMKETLPGVKLLNHSYQLVVGYVGKRVTRDGVRNRQG